MVEALAAVATLNGLQRPQAGPLLESADLNGLPDAQAPPKDLFVATLAHELRQPLSTMLAAVEVVRIAPGTDAARRAADAMCRQLSQMSRLVEDLVDAARWAHGKVALQRHRLDLRHLIADAADDVEGEAVERGQLIVVRAEGAPIWVDGDSHRLQQVVSNLLRNAVKYTQSGGQIVIALEPMATDVTLRIRDNGRGIEADALPHVFELFSQTCPQDGLGLGLGLSIVHDIVLQHGGSIAVRSDGAGKGSEFAVCLPLAEMLAQ